MVSPFIFKRQFFSVQWLYALILSNIQGMVVDVKYVTSNCVDL